MDLPLSINHFIDCPPDNNIYSPLSSVSNPSALPSEETIQTPVPCCFADFQLTMKTGKSLYAYLGYSEPSIKRNPLGKMIVTFIKQMGADWPTTRPPNSCHTALVSRNLANQFLDEGGLGANLWADFDGAKVWVKNEIEIRHAVHHIFIQKQKSTNIAWYKEQRTKRDLEEETATTLALTATASGLLPKIKHEPQEASFDLEHSLSYIEDSDAQCSSVARIKTLLPRDEPLRELTREWLYTDLARWPASANAALELLMHERNYYNSWDDGYGTLEPKLLQGLRKGTELQEFEDGREFNIFDRRLNQQVQTITVELRNLGFVDDDLDRCELFDRQWRRRRSIWKNMIQEVEDNRKPHESSETHVDHEEDLLNSIHVSQPLITESQSNGLLRQNSEIGNRTTSSYKRKRKPSGKASQDNETNENRPVRRRRISKAGSKTHVKVSKPTPMGNSAFTSGFSGRLNDSLIADSSASSFLGESLDEARPSPLGIETSSMPVIRGVAPIASMLEQGESYSNIPYQSPSHVENIEDTDMAASNDCQHRSSSMAVSSNVNLGTMRDKIPEAFLNTEHLAASDPKDASRVSQSSEDAEDVDSRLWRPRQSYSSGWTLANVRIVVDSTPLAHRLLLIFKLEALSSAARKRQAAITAPYTPASPSLSVANPSASTPITHLFPQTALSSSEDFSMGSMHDEDTPSANVSSNDSLATNSSSTVHLQCAANDVSVLNQMSSSRRSIEIIAVLALDPSQISNVDPAAQATFPIITTPEDETLRMTGNMDKSFLPESSSNEIPPADTASEVSLPTSDLPSPQVSNGPAANLVSEPPNPAINSLAALATSPNPHSSSDLSLPSYLLEEAQAQARVDAHNPDVRRVSGQYQLPGGAQDRISTTHFSELEVQEQQRGQAASSGKDLAVVAERNDRIQIQFVTNENEYTKSMAFECLENETLDGFFKLFSEQSGFPYKSLTKLKLEQDFGEARQFCRKLQISRNDSYAEWKLIKKRLFKNFQNALASARNQPDFLDMQFFVVVDKA